MDRLDLVPQVVDQAHHGLEVPASAAHALPYLAVVFERSEGNQSVVGGAATEDLGARVSNVRIACHFLRMREFEIEDRTYHWVAQWSHNRNLGHHQAE